jgi:hypothetical protein
MIWIVWAVIIGIIFIFLKYSHIKKNVMLVLVLILIILVYFSMTTMINSGEMDFSSPRTALTSFTFYFNWLGQTSMSILDIGKDTVKTVGNVIKLNQTEEKR